MRAQALVKSTVASRCAWDRNVRESEVSPDIAHATWRSISVNFSTEQDSIKGDAILFSATDMTGKVFSTGKVKDAINKTRQYTFESGKSSVVYVMHTSITNNLLLFIYSQ